MKQKGQTSLFPQNSPQQQTLSYTWYYSFRGYLNLVLSDKNMPKNVLDKIYDDLQNDRF